MCDGNGAVSYTHLDVYKRQQMYAALAKKANGKSALASVLEGDIAAKQKNAGLASQKYEAVSYTHLLGAENRSRQLFNKNTGLCQIERSRIQPDTCPVLEG